MKTYTNALIALILAVITTSQLAFAFQPKEIAAYFNGPTVKNVTATSATVSLSPSVLAGLTDEEKANIYFEYYNTHQACIAIYPTPEACLPKKTQRGISSVTLTDLTPNTSYTITYKRDNTIRCITSPCPGNDFQSLSVEFTTTTTQATTSVAITNNLFIGSRGTQVTALQTILIQKGYMSGTATGYFGFVTFQAVRSFQRDMNISAIGYVGPLTRKALNNPPSANESTFEGTITAYSTGCFVDGECSVTVDGRKVVTTIGWTQGPVGTVTGIPDFGSIEGKVGSHAKVYAKKTDTGYTLYGNTNYYIQIQ